MVWGGGVGGGRGLLHGRGFMHGVCAGGRTHRLTKAAALFLSH